MTTHAHRAGEFGAKKRTKKELQKDPEYRLGRAEHYAHIVAKATGAHAKSSGSERAAHALVIAHGLKRVEHHARIVEKLAPGSAMARVAKAHASMAQTHAKMAASAPEKATKSAKIDATEHAIKQAIPDAWDAAKREKPLSASQIATKDAFAKTKKASDDPTQETQHAAASAHRTAAEEAKIVGDAKTQALHEKQANHHRNRAETIKLDGTPATDAQITHHETIPTTAKTMEESAFQNHRKEFHKTLTEDEHRAGHAYAMEGYIGINDGLRAGNVGYNERTIGHLDSMIAKSSMPKHTIVHRGAGDAAVLAHYAVMKTDDIYHEKAYSSTSAHEGEAFKTAVVMHITVPKGGRAAAIPSSSPKEREFLLPRDQKFRVDRTEQTADENGKLRLTMHVTALQENQ